MKISILDDYHDTAESLALLLRNEGFQATSTCKGSLSLQIAAATRPQVVLCDLAMPVLSGFEVAWRIRRIQGYHPLLVAITAYGSEEARQQSRQAGFDLHLVKPVDPLALIEILTKYAATLDEPGTEG